MPEGAIFHLNVATISRSDGRSSVAAAAYRAGSKLNDTRTGIEHDYTRKQGVIETFIAAPDGCDWITDRNTLWDAAEAAEKRKNSVVAREWLVALPDALSATQRAELTRALATELVTRYGVAVDVAIHAPSRNGDQRNHHAHLLATTRVAEEDGLGAKTRILDAAKTGGPEIAAMREWWAGTVNDALKACESKVRVDHRRRSVIVEEMKAKAEVLEAQAEEIDIVQADADGLKDFFGKLGGFAKAARSGGLAALTAKPGQAEVLREQAQSLTESADILEATPLNKHAGPQLTAYKRRMKPTWDAEKKAEAERQARLAEMQRQQAEHDRAKREKAREEEEARLEAERDRKYLRDLAERHARDAQILIDRARENDYFARYVRSWGIELDRKDFEVARDEIWTMYVEGRRNVLVWEAIQEEADKLDRLAAEEAAMETEAERRKNVERFIVGRVKAVAHLPTPAKGTGMFGSEILEPDHIRSSFRKRYSGELEPEEVTRTVRTMLAEWVGMIVKALSDMKPLRSIWLALTGDDEKAAHTLKASLDDHPDLARPLRNVILSEESKRQNSVPQNDPEPDPDDDPNLWAYSSGPSGP